jgi:Uri superfamily endonuclease
VLAVKGIYVLLIQLGKDTDVTVGKLGTLHFPKGLYAYVGSAQNGIEKRISRHLRNEKRMFWHIDYLLQNPTAKIMKVFTKTGGKAEECTIAKRISENSAAISNFGCSDCRCISHLFSIVNCDFLHDSMREYKVPTFSASS